MNKVILMGRATRDPEIRYTAGEDSKCVAKTALAVDRKVKNGEQTADFINLTAFGKTGEFFEKFVKKGKKLVVEGHIQTGSYTNKDGVKIYTTDVIVESVEFAESKASEGGADAPAADIPQIPQIEDSFAEELPFN